MKSTSLLLNDNTPPLREGAARHVAPLRSFAAAGALAAALGAALLAQGVHAAGAALVPPDTNTRIDVLDARVADGVTEVLYQSSPNLGDPLSGKDCPLNVYAVTLRPGLPDPEQRLIAKGRCTFIGNRGRLQPDGSALLLLGGRLERWRDGERIASVAFTDVAAFGESKADATNTGQHFDLAPNGDLVAAVPFQSGKNYRKSDRGADIVALDAAGKARWKVRLAVPGEQVSIAGVWAGTNGGALVRAYANVTNGTTPSTDRRLYPIGPGGELREPVVIGQDKQLDTERLANLTPAEQARIGELLKDTYMEGIRELDVHARPDGGFDVLLDRTSGPEEREGQFLYRIGAEGSLAQVLNLTGRIGDHGLDHWVDFYTDGEQLVLLGEVTATQPGIEARRDTYDQVAVTWVDLGGGAPLTRLIPLDQRYLAAVMGAGDEDIQHIENRPGGEPALLTRVGPAPLAISIGYLQGRAALRLDEATGDLVAWDEHFQAQQKKVAKEEARQERKAARKTRQQQFESDMAAAAGMSPEEYAALSNKEQAAAMIKSGNMDAMMAAAQQQAAQAMAEAARQQEESGQPMDPQTAAAMQQAMAAMQAAGLDPEAVAGAMGTAQGSAAAGTTDDILALDASQRGFVDYEHPDGAPVTLLIADRAGGEALLRKDYADGVIYEHIDFARFGLPLGRIRVQYLDAEGEALEELTPTVVR